MDKIYSLFVSHDQDNSDKKGVASELSTHVLIPPGMSHTLGSPKVSIESNPDDNDTSANIAVNLGYKLLRREGLILSAPEVSYSWTDTPDYIQGGSAGLSFFYGFVSDILFDNNVRLDDIAATGKLDKNGNVIKISDINEKLKAVLELSPSVKYFVYPHENGSELNSDLIAQAKGKLIECCSVSNIIEACQAVDIKLKASIHGSPYKGLKSFLYEDSGLFFGRKAITKEIITKIRKERNVLLLGPSGSGKSSLVLAGVLPELNKKDQKTVWSVFRPDDVKSQEKSTEELQLLNLQKAILSSWGIEYTDTESLKSEEELANKLLEKISSHNITEYIWVIDQFEELFTQVKLTQSIDYLVNMMNILIIKNVLIIGTMRNDYYDSFTQHAELTALFPTTKRIDIPLPDRYSIGCIIEEPLKLIFPEVRFGFNENGISLATKLIEDAGANFKSLPLLEISLDMLYEKRIQDEIPFDLYEKEIGGLYGALDKHAENVYENLDTDLQKVFSKVLLDVVTENDEHKVAAKSISIDIYLPDSNERKLVDTLVLPDSRLFTIYGNKTTGEVFVRVSHESILWHWERAKEIIRINWSDIQTLKQLESEAKKWDDAEGSKKNEILLKGSILTDAVDTLERKENRSGLHFGKSNNNNNFFSSLTKVFVNKKTYHSITEKVVADFVEQSSREFKKNLIYRYSTISFVFLILLATTLYSLQKTSQATHQSELAKDNLILSVVNDDDPTQGLQLLRDVKHTEEVNWLDKVHLLLSKPIAALNIPFLKQWIESAVFLKDDSIITLSYDGFVRQYFLDDPSSPKTLFPYKINSVYFSPSGNQLLIINIKGKVEIHFLNEKNKIIDIEPEPNDFKKAIFSYNSQYLALFSHDYSDETYKLTIKKDNGNSFNSIYSLTSKNPIKIQFSSNSNKALIFTEDKIDIISFNGVNWKSVGELDRDQRNDYLLSPDGSIIGVTDYSGKYSSINVSTMNQISNPLPSELENLAFKIFNYSFYSDKVVLVESRTYTDVKNKPKNILHIVDLKKSSSKTIVVPDVIVSASFSKTDKHIIVVTKDNSVRVWRTYDIDQNENYSPILNIDNKWNDQAIFSAVLNDKEDHLLIQSVFGQARVWPLNKEYNVEKHYSNSTIINPLCEDEEQEDITSSFFINKNEVVSLKFDGLIEHFDLNSGLKTPIYKTDRCESIMSADINAKKELILITGIDDSIKNSNNKFIRILNIKTKKIISEKYYSEISYDAVFNPNKPTEITVRFNNDFNICDLINNSLDCKIIFNILDADNFSYSPDGKKIALTDKDGSKLFVIDTESRSLINQTSMVSIGQVGDMVLLDSSLVMGTMDGNLLLFNNNDFDNPVELSNLGDRVWSMTADKTEKTVFIATDGGDLLQWKTDGTGLKLKIHMDIATAMHVDVHDKSNQIIVSTDETKFILFKYEESSIKDEIDRMTKSCLFPDQRQKILNETKEESIDNFLTCEQSHGRNTTYMPGIHHHHERSNSTPRSMTPALPKTQKW